MNTADYAREQVIITGGKLGADQVPFLQCLMDNVPGALSRRHSFLDYAEKPLSLP